MNCENEAAAAAAKKELDNLKLMLSESQKMQKMVMTMVETMKESARENQKTQQQINEDVMKRMQFMIEQSDKA